MKHALCQGAVWHQRLTPVLHRFSYPLWLLRVDLEDIDGLLAGHWSWGRRWRPLTVREQDYLTPPAAGDTRPLHTRVRDKAASLGLDWREGRVWMLAQPRCLGWLFNPLVLYWHIPPGASQADSVVAEVSNTPWHERHWYALVADGDGTFSVQQDKAFHVSPFMGMAMQYRWWLAMNDASITVRIENWAADEQVFVAGMRLQCQPASGEQLGSVLRRFGWQTLRVSAAIYAQAFRLWRKGVPFHRHPAKADSADTRQSSTEK